MLNHFFFKKAGAGETAEDLSEAFILPGSWLPLINDMQTTKVKNVSVNVINMGDPTDFFEALDTHTGLAIQDALPPQDCYQFTLKLNTRAIRAGSKRFSGIPATQTTDGIITGSDEILNMNLVATIMAEPLVGAGAAIYNHVVVKRVGLPTPGTPPYTSYRLPTSDGEVMTGLVVAVLAKTRVSHQTTRGNGR